MIENQKKKVFDLEERTGLFGENVLGFCKSVKKDNVANPVIIQLVRSATSIGANYCEADCAESRKDFEHKLSICKKESKETRYWLRMLKVILPESLPEIQALWQEANELQLIFISIIKKSKENNN